MKVETLRRIAREYRLVAERKLDDKELCKGFSDLCRDEGIAWTQLRALVDAEAADARDDGERVKKIVEKADFASAYADILAGRREDEQKQEIRSSAIKETVSIAAGTPHVAERPARTEPAPSSVRPEPVQTASLEIPDLPPFLDRRGVA